MPSAWLAASLLWCATAKAAGVPVRVHYLAPPGCGSTDSFLAELAARNPEARFAWSGEAAFELAVVVEPRASEVVGALYLSDPAGLRTVRVVPGQNCDDVTAALALIAAVLTNPHRAAPPAATVPSPPAAPSPPARNRTWWVGGGAGLGLHWGVMPQHPAVGPSFELAGGLEARSVLSPLLSIGLSHARGTVEKDSLAATFDWTAGRLAGCPIQWPARGLFSLRPCAWLEAGRLAGSGSEPTPIRHRAEVTWWATGWLVRAELRLLEPLAVVAEAGLVIPLLSDSFYFEPGTEVFQVPPVTMDGRLGLIARVW